MIDFVRFALLGLGLGAVYGLLAQGLVLIFLGNKVINFSQGAIALVSAYVYYEAARAGVPLAGCAVAALLVSAAIGAIIELCIMRPLRGSSAVTRLVATIGVLIVVQSAAALRYGDTTQFVEGLLPQQMWDFGSRMIISSDRAILFGIGIAITCCLIFLHNRTRFGLATAAVAESPRAAAVLGWSPHWISLINWMLGASLAGLAGILVAPINGLNVAAMNTVIYGAVAATLVGGFRSFALAMAGGTALGIAQAECVRIGGDIGWSTAIPFIVIVVAIVLRRNLIPIRSEAPRQLAGVGTGNLNIPGIILGLSVLLTASFFVSGNVLDALSTSLIAALLGLSIVILTGYAGQLSLATYSLAGLGALAAAYGANNFGAAMLGSLVLAAIAGAGGGLGVALISVRVRGDILAIVTMALALAFEALVLSNPSLTGGISGLAMPRPSLFGLSIDALAHPQRYLFFCASMFVLCCLIISNLRRGATGRRLLSIRSSERAATTLGIGVGATKGYAHAVAGAIAGLAGGLEAFSQPQMVFSSFTVDATMALLVGVVLGGTGYIASAAVAGLAVTGGVIYYLLSLTGWQEYLPLALGLSLLVNLVFVPNGVVPQNIAALQRLKVKLGGRAESTATRSPEAASTPATMPATDTPVQGNDGLQSHVEIRDVSVAFGGVVALNRVDATIRSGKVEGLIGPNGAGKTSFIDTVTGLTLRHRGDVLLDGKSISHMPAAARALRGIGRTLQGLELFEDLTVLENLMIGSEVHDSWARVRDLAAPRPVRLSAGATMAAQRFGLMSVLSRRPSELPYGQRRLVAIARAVAAEPRFLLLDEPAAGLAASERDELARMIRDLVEHWDMGILLIEHDVDLVMRVCDSITVLESGSVIASGTPDMVRRDTAVRRAFLGTAEAA